MSIYTEIEEELAKEGKMYCIDYAKEAVRLINSQLQLTDHIIYRYKYVYKARKSMFG